MKKYIVCLLSIACLCCAFPVSAQHPLGIDDWPKLRNAFAFGVAPDGATILYRVDFGGAKGHDHHEWRLISADGSNSRELKLPKDFTPIGFPRDASVLYGGFVKDKHQQLATVSMAAPDANPAVLTSIPSGMSWAVLSSDGSRFAVLANPQPVDPLAEVHTVVENELTSIYVVNIDGSNGAWWCPDLKQVSALAWSRDGASLAVVSQTPMIGYHYIHSRIDICSPSGVRHIADIPNVAASEGGEGGIVWINDGKELAFLSTTTNVVTPDHVWTVSLAGGKPVDRTPDLVGSAIQISGDARGNVWVLVMRGVRGEVDSFSNGELKPVYQWPNGVVRSVPVESPIASAPERLAFTVGDPEHLSNIAVVDGGKLKKITFETDDQLASITFGAKKIVHWTSKEGVPLEGIVTFPPNYVAGKKYPFLVYPHGGPESNDLFDMGALARIIASAGYVVMQPEYRGSTGYGTTFLESIYQHFGDRAYRDVDSATDFAIAQGWADPNRLAIFGWSAGGFMTSWTITQTHRYRAAIEGAGITDWLSFIWTSDVQQIDFDARWPDQDPTAFTRFSAAMHAADVTTPLLILHGDADARVPAYQGREYYLALAARGKTVRMVTYPGSPHFPVIWEQRIDVAREILAWLARYNP
jgi:dipeptidyl aminopeptidase/acylaminoacyl peptidase